MSLKAYQMTNRAFWFMRLWERFSRIDYFHHRQVSIRLSSHLEDVEAGEDVFMFEEPHHLELPEDALTAD